ncbi:unnamed protein product [Camellia sinensis]
MEREREKWRGFGDGGGGGGEGGLVLVGESEEEGVFSRVHRNWAEVSTTLPVNVMISLFYF